MYIRLPQKENIFPYQPMLLIQVSVTIIKTSKMNRMSLDVKYTTRLLVVVLFQIACQLYIIYRY